MFNQHRGARVLHWPRAPHARELARAVLASVRDRPCHSPAANQRNPGANRAKELEQKVRLGAGPVSVPRRPLVPDLLRI